MAPNPDHDATSEGATTDKRARLERQLGPVQWRDLQAHVLREAVFLVHPSLDLLTCAVVIADDDTEVVGAWIDAGKPHARA